MRILIDAGALDGWGLNRASMHENLGKVLVYADLVKTEIQGQISFDFSVVSKPNLMKLKENPLERAKKEFRVYGFYLSEHPVQRLRQNQYPRCIPLSQCESREGYLEVIGRILNFRSHKTKQGDPMAFVSIEDESGKLDLVIMPSLYEKVKDQLQKDRIVYAKTNKNRPQSAVCKDLTWIDPDI